MGRHPLAALSHGRRLAVLVGVAALSLAVVGPLAWSYAGSVGLAGAISACAVCTLGAALALSLGWLISAEQAPLLHLGAGLFLRMVFPLGYALFVMKTNPALVSAGALYSLVVFYMVTLAVETALTLPDAAPLRSPSHTRNTGAPTHG